MIDPVWTVLIGGSIPLIGIIITQYLIYKQVQTGRVSEKRNEYFIEGHKQLQIVAYCLGQFESKIDTKKNINKIQEIVEKHPYYFPHDFLIGWIEFRNPSTNISTEKSLDALFKSIKDMMTLFNKKFFIEVLGFNLKEFSEYGDALFGRKRITK